MAKPEFELEVTIDKDRMSAQFIELAVSVDFDEDIIDDVIDDIPPAGCAWNYLRALVHGCGDPLKAKMSETAIGEMLYSKKPKTPKGTDGVAVAETDRLWVMTIVDDTETLVYIDEGEVCPVSDVYEFVDEHIRALGGKPPKIAKKKPKPKFGAGDIVMQIAGVEEQIGFEGEVFYYGRGKWGDAIRVGYLHEDGENYWASIEELELIKKGVPKPPREFDPERGNRVFENGDVLKITEGTQNVGKVGVVFWYGPAKFGEGMRVGMTGRDGKKYWVDVMDLDPLKPKT